MARIGLLLPLFSQGDGGKLDIMLSWIAGGYYPEHLESPWTFS
jgi:hypothetical protein